MIVDLESRFSPPDNWCRNPHWWHSTDDHSTEIEVTEMIAGLVRATQPDLVVETGAAWGQTAQAIGVALAANGHGHLVSLEPDPERNTYATERCQGLPVQILPVSSLDYEPTGPVGLLFSDSLFPLRCPEYWHYAPHMTPGAVVVFHDTKPGHGGGQVGEHRGLSHQIAAELPGPWINLRTPRGVTIGQIQ